ncbi:putative T6SS immunity periplasmic lipoprotein [Serratia rhizosphaerae]|uniref:putative T6SS immunity periplasmic lipoprotein n=1 Tax=unclassified Serratia (in: enterobacteria) TaxID=2647522 RepID=UPI000CF6D54E|nr:MULTISPECIES: putative T6SS immunity periplasmic lipoprotein [unclassified Serratia (in: enterobacteria)]QPT12156.1 hypothetical protein I6G37_16850 [Serratia rubidaea]AVJ18600.1 hypothetical protein CLM71_16430 [Serratia sp. MYb239]QNK33898.1 hypothetical protein HF675_07600 [Serratia sp. JUb9]CAE1148224.1 conserved protein of unknown function [Serratia sp. Tan611]SQJ14518.1 Uncharacterised protein [Serratia rubidaea]
MKRIYTLIITVLLSGCMLEKQRFYAAEVVLQGSNLCFSLPAEHLSADAKVNLVSIAIDQRQDKQTREVWRRSVMPPQPAESVSAGQCIPYSFSAFENDVLYTVAISTVASQDADSKRFWQRSFSLKIDDGRILQVITGQEP